MVIMVKYMGIQGKEAWEIIDNWGNVKFLNCHHPMMTECWV